MTTRLLFLIALIGGTTMSAFGQFQVGAQIGLAFNESDLFIGGNAIFNSPWELGDRVVQLNPEVNFYFLEDIVRSDQSGTVVIDQSRTVVTLNGLYPLELEFANTYLGAGVLLKIYKTDFGADFDDTDVGLNTKVGIDFGKEDATIVPWIEGGVQIVDGGGLWLQGGARLAL